MFSAEALRQFFSVQGAAWTSTAILALFVLRMWNGSPAMFAQWIAYRRAKAEERSADWARRGDELTRLDARCIRLEEAEERCREELADATKRIASLEGYNDGEGRAMNEAQRMLSEEREADALKRRGSGGGDA